MISVISFSVACSACPDASTTSGSKAGDFRLAENDPKLASPISRLDDGLTISSTRSRSNMSSEKQSDGDDPSGFFPSLAARRFRFRDILTPSCKSTCNMLGTCRAGGSSYRCGYLGRFLGTMAQHKSPIRQLVQGAPARNTSQRTLRLLHAVHARLDRAGRVSPDLSHESVPIISASKTPKHSMPSSSSIVFTYDCGAEVGSRSGSMAH